VLIRTGDKLTRKHGDGMCQLLRGQPNYYSVRIFADISFDIRAFKMNYLLHAVNDVSIAELTKENPVIHTAQEFLEIMMNLPADTFTIYHETLDDAFFDLKSGLAGEILQKVVNYSRRLGIVGDVTPYTSKSLQDFIRECNRSNTIVFMDTFEEAARRLSA